MAAPTETGSFGGLDPAVQKLEFNVTVLPTEEPSVQAALRQAGIDPVRRKVYFYDTPGLALAARNLFVRARVTEGEDDDSTVKVRPLSVPVVPGLWRAVGDVSIELDVVGTEHVHAAKLDHAPGPGRVEQVARGDLKPSTLFNKAQEALIEVALPRGTSLNDLAVLGPVDARKWELPPDALPYALSVEEWSLPDATRSLELSFKADPDEAELADDAFDWLLDRLDIDRDREQPPKTLTVLDFFAERLG